MPSNSKKPTFAGLLLQHLIVFLICIVFPGLTTMVAPASWLTFNRVGNSVNCTARTCAFFVVPFKTQHITSVTEITSRELAGRTERKRRYGRGTNEQVYIDGEGFLQIHGAGDQLIEVSVSPASLTSVVERSNEFLQSSQTSSKTLFAIANWKFGALMGGVLTLFTVLYVVGCTLGFLKLMFLGIKRMLPGAEADELH